MKLFLNSDLRVKKKKVTVAKEVILGNLVTREICVRTFQRHLLTAAKVNNPIGQWWSPHKEHQNGKQCSPG